MSHTKRIYISLVGAIVVTALLLVGAHFLYKPYQSQTITLQPKVVNVYKTKKKIVYKTKKIIDKTPTKKVAVSNTKTVLAANSVVDRAEVSETTEKSEPKNINEVNEDEGANKEHENEQEDENENEADD